MKSPTKDDFLEVYKNLEAVLSGNGFTWQNGGKGLVAQYEDTLPLESETRRALQQCRMMRNSYQHNNQTLFLPTLEATKLLNDLTKKIDKRKCAKDVMTRPKKYLLSDKPAKPGIMTDVVMKGYTLPIVSDTGEYLGAINEHVLLLLFSQSRNVQLKTFLNDPVILAAVQKTASVVDADTPALELVSGTVYAVLNSKKKYRGMIERW